MAETKPSNNKGFSLDQIPTARLRPLWPRVRGGKNLHLIIIHQTFFRTSHSLMLPFVCTDVLEIL